MLLGHHERIAGRVHPARQQHAEQRLGHAHLHLLGARGQAELGADDPLPRGHPPGHPFGLDGVALLQGEVGEAVGQPGDGDAVAHGRLEAVGAVGDRAHAALPALAASAAAIWMIWSSWPPTSFCRPHSSRMSAPLTP